MDHLVSGGTDWAAQQMAEFLSVVTSYPDEQSAQASAIERIVESVEAEVGAIVRDGELVISIGWPMSEIPTQAIIEASVGQHAELEVPGLGACEVTCFPLDDSETTLLLGRYRSERFGAQELNLVRGMARVLALGLKTMRLVRSERLLRTQTEQQAAELEAAQSESFQHSLSHMSTKAAVERRALEEQLRQAQKMEAVGRLAGGIAHDFNNLLMVIQTSAFLLKSELEAASIPTTDVAEIMDAGDRAARLVRQLLTFSRKEVAHPEILDMNEQVSVMGDLLKRSIGVGIELLLELCEGTAFVSIDPAHLDQIVMNLAINGRDAMDGEGTLSIRTEKVTLDHEAAGSLPAGDYMRLEVADSGCGMEPELIDKIFEPFFTTKEQGRGTGLGLATVYGIVSSLGGHIDVSSEVGEGTTFTFLVPTVEQRGESDLSQRQEAPSLGAEAANILVVDDQPSIGELVKRLLLRHGYVVATATSADEALEFILKGLRFDLVLSDVAMPGMTGVELARRIRDLAPEQPIALMSGYLDDRITDSSIIEDVVGFIEKPFQERNLLALVRSLPETNAPASSRGVITRTDASHDKHRPFAQERPDETSSSTAPIQI